MMKEKIEACFDALQELDMKPTPGNVSIMNGVYSFLREVYAEIEKGENDGGRIAADSE
jgi:hypothetical protein